MIIKFCDVCNNLFYLKIEDKEKDNKQELYYFCKNCGHTKKHEQEENNCIFDKYYDNGKYYQHIINKYTIYDDTLPRVNNIECPNTDCICNQNSSVDNKVIYIKYDQINLKFLYICCHCNTAWKNNSNGNKENQVELIELT